MRIAITLVLIALAAGIAGTFALSRLISSEELRAQIIEQAETTSGRTVLVDGRMDVGLLPRPTLSLGATRFLGARPGTQPVLDVDRIDFGVAPLALLRGEIE
ncbi:MAG: AsmA family protein, partial [Geminicoccaceae bacterium]|nr:AsmA family protein [Geminicoccaceae bacterium]